MPQTCKLCAKADGFDFHVPDDVWASVVPPGLRTRVVCLACFDELARVRGVHYAPHLTSLYFAGVAAAFELKVSAVADLVS